MEFDTKTPEGLKAYEEFQRHIATGAPVTFKSPHLAEFRVPEFMRRLFEFSDEGMEIRIEQPPGEESLTVRIEIECEDGHRSALDHIELKRVHGGTNEITFTNEGQAEPAKVLLVLKYMENKFKFGCRVDYAGLNVNQALQRLRFFEAMAKDGLLRVTHLDSGLEILLARVTAGQHPRPEPQWSKTLERLAVIQSKTGTPLFVPEDDIKLDEVRRIYETAHIVETGHTTFKFGQLSTSGGLKMAKNVLREFSGGRSTSMLWQFDAVQTAMILDVEIPIGPVVMSCERVMVTEEDLETLRTAIDLSSPTSSLPIRFTAVDDCPVAARYPDWLPADEKASMTALIASLSSRLDPVVEGLFRAAEQDGVIDVDQLVQVLAETRQAAAPEGEKTNSITKATPEELRAALEPLMDEMQPDDRFKFAAKLFEKNLLSSGKASRLAGMDRVTFLTSLHTVGVAAIDLDEGELEDQKRYIESQ